MDFNNYTSRLNQLIELEEKIILAKKAIAISGNGGRPNISAWITGGRGMNINISESDGEILARIWDLIAQHYKAMLPSLEAKHKEVWSAEWTNEEDAPGHARSMNPADA